MPIFGKKGARIPEVNDTGPARTNAMASIRGDAFRVFNTRIGLWALAVLLSCFLSSNLARAEPEPGQYYADNFSGDPESMHLLQRLRQLVQRGREINEQEREITDEAMAIESVLEAKSNLGIPPHFSQRELGEDDGGEPLPVPSPRRSPPYEKRGSYMALCHFKICNMGRKRQLLTQVRTKVPSVSSWVSLGPRSSSTLLRLPRS